MQYSSSPIDACLLHFFEKANVIKLFKERNLEKKYTMYALFCKQ